MKDKRLGAPSEATDDMTQADQQEHSPFEQAAKMPLEHAAARQHQGQKKKRGFLSSVFCCTAPSTAGDAVEVVPVHVAAASSQLSTSAKSSVLSLQNSWARVEPQLDKHVSIRSRTSSEWFDACSQHSLELPQLPIEAADAPKHGNEKQQDKQVQHDDVHNVQQQQQQEPDKADSLQQQEQEEQQQHQVMLLREPEPPAPQTAPWIPARPLMFAKSELKFVPVPAVTGFAGIWDVVEERSDPHPQPIDVMIGANAIVRKIHESMPGITLEDTDHQFKVIGQPTFIPKGFPSAHTETYDKKMVAFPSWAPRRDVRLGTGRAVGIYFTADKQLILVHEAWPLFGRQADYWVEDYMTLEENGTIIVDRMCCYCYKTGRRAEQVQVVRLRQ